jgi:hypothetical protein
MHPLNIMLYLNRQGTSSMQIPLDNIAKLADKNIQSAINLTHITLVKGLRHDIFQKMSGLIVFIIDLTECRRWQRSCSSLPQCVETTFG